MIYIVYKSLTGDDHSRVVYNKYNAVLKHLRLARQLLTEIHSINQDIDKPCGCLKIDLGIQSELFE